MKRLCDEVQDDLPLYAEGELADAVRAARVRLHLAACVECRQRLLDHDRLTRAILEAERRGRPSPERRGEFASRVMALVRCEAARQRKLRRAAAAAAAVLFLGLAAGTGAWIAGRHGDEDRPAGAIARNAPQPAAARAAPAPADLQSAWWIIGSEEGPGERAAREIEAMLYALREGNARPAPGGELLMLRALLGAASRELPDGSARYRFLMVPEEGGADGTIPVRPVALPVAVAERDLAPPARIRLHGPTRRYRLLWTDSVGFPRALVPTAIPRSLDDHPDLLRGLAPEPEVPPGPRIEPRLLSPERY